MNLLALCNCVILTPKSMKFFYRAISICFRTMKKLVVCLFSYIIHRRSPSKFSMSIETHAFKYIGVDILPHEREIWVSHTGCLTSETLGLPLQHACLFIESSRCGILCLELPLDFRNQETKSRFWIREPRIWWEKCVRHVFLPNHKGWPLIVWHKTY